MTYGPKYRLPKTYNWKLVYNQVDVALNTCIAKWSKKERIDSQAFAQWKQEVLKKVKYNINRKKHIHKKYRPRFNKQQIMRKLQEIHNDYVVVGADKAMKTM